jgi:cohesin loading factor subunit SCC2
MVYNNTSIEVVYPSPPKRSPAILPSKVGSKRQKTSPTPKVNQDAKLNHHGHHQNSTITVQMPTNGSENQFVTPPRPSPSPARPKSNFQVVIPKLPDEFRRENYTPSKPLAEPPAQVAAQPKITPIPPPPRPSQLAQRATPQQQSIPPSSSSPGLAIVIPDLPSTFRPKDYEVLPGSPDTPQHLSKKRKRSDLDGDEDDILRSVDQREKADAAERNLEEFLQDIFEAEDQLDADNMSSNQFFTATSEGTSLTIQTQTKVESLLEKVISVGRFSQAPLEDLLRLQKFCEGALKDAGLVEVKVDDTMGESEVANLLQNLSTAELGIKAARTSLRVMSGGREDKQLYSEDVIQAALDAFKNVTENCIIPVVEMRSSGSSTATFKLLSAEKKVILNLLTQCRRLFSFLARLVSDIELSETVTNSLEFTASRLIFVENAHSEKESILGVSKFDSLRVVAMDVLAQIFLCNPAQRQGIFDEILTSLEKLPTTKQSSRQFKLAEGGNIQLVSALIMRLIQTSANKSDEAKEKRRSKALNALNGDEESVESGHDLQSHNFHFTITEENKADQQPVTAIQELKTVVSPLLDTAASNAKYVVNFIVARATNSTKTGDTPYRNLLDLFVEDFITCLSSTDWPAAELLLRLFLFKMVNLAEGEKTPAPAKNMALDLLGLMGAAISELNSSVRRTASTLENGESDLGRYLSRLAEASLENRASGIDLVSWACGPFRVCVEFLDHRASEDPQLKSVTGFFTAEWAAKTCSAFDQIGDKDYETERECGRLAYRLRKMVADRTWLSTEYTFDSITPAHARLAYSLTLLHSQFCAYFRLVLRILLTSMTSEQATVRSKSLKSVNQVLDTDPTILDREIEVKQRIVRCSNDSSIQVRDSALGLIGKCISLRPALEDEMIANILDRVSDIGIGVRKRAMKLAKEIYLRNSNSEVRSRIADSLLHRVTDLDEGVQELARQTIEDVWMSPFYKSTSSDETSPKFKLAMADHVALMVKTVQRGSSGVATVLDKVLQNMLSNDSKFPAANFKVCKALVATMFETIIDNPVVEGDGAPSARDAMQILTIFAKSNPKLFTAEQIQLLQPYVKNLVGSDDLAIFRSVVIIFRHVLPDLPKVHTNFLVAVRQDLQVALLKIPRVILDDLLACFWIISKALDDFLPITRIALSTFDNINKLSKVTMDEALVKRLVKLLMIIGMIGKHCDLDPQYLSFRKVFPSWKGDSVSKLMVSTFAPFAASTQPIEVRKAALDAIGMVCQSWPKNFSEVNIYTRLEEAFNEKNTALESIILQAFKDFLLLEEKRSEAGAEGIPGAAADPEAKLGVMGGGHGDGIALGIAQRFLKYIVHIALSRQDDEALLAAETLASITRQGLVHPKETGSTLIALETSENPKISDLAFREHRALQVKHETILEKEYMRAVNKAYIYQRDVVQDHHGARRIENTTGPPSFTAKLHLMIDVLKISTTKNRKKFYDNLCARIEFDPANIDIKNLPHHLEFSQFLIENMAFFEYATVEEVFSAIAAMERVVAATGIGIAESIKAEIFPIDLAQPFRVDEIGQSQPVPPTINSDRLLQLTASSMMLSILWEARTYLRRQYGLLTNRREGKGKAASKDMTKAPVRVQGVDGRKFWDQVSSTMDTLVEDTLETEENALKSEEKMMSQCRAFVELLEVDKEFKITAEGDEERATPSEDEDNVTPRTPTAPGSGRGRKRKSSDTPGGRKKRARSGSVQARPRGRPKGSGKRASVGESDEEGDDW